MRRLGSQNGLNVRLDGPDGTRIVWSLGSCTAPGDWGSDQVDVIQRLLPHIRQFVRVRQALAGANALGASLVELIDHSGIGVIQLDRRGRIVEANGPACDSAAARRRLVRPGRFPGRLVARGQRQAATPLGPFARTLRRAEGQAGSGSTTIRRSPGLAEACRARQSRARPRAGFQRLAHCGVGADSGARGKPAEAQCRVGGGGSWA